MTHAIRVLTQSMLSFRHCQTRQFWVHRIYCARIDLAWNIVGGNRFSCSICKLISVRGWEMLSQFYCFSLGSCHINIIALLFLYNAILLWRLLFSGQDYISSPPTSTSLWRRLFSPRWHDMPSRAKVQFAQEGCNWEVQRKCGLSKLIQHILLIYIIYSNILFYNFFILIDKMHRPFP